MPKTKEELDTLKKEYQELTSKLEELSKEELENVTGGGCQTHSSDTYRSFGYNPGNGQSADNHPLIVTLGNSCKLAKGGSTCYGCDNRFTSGLTSYCIARSKELDPCK